MLTKRIKLNLIFKLSYLNSNFALTMAYLNPALNNPVLRITQAGAPEGQFFCILAHHVLGFVSISMSYHLSYATMSGKRSPISKPSIFFLCHRTDKEQLLVIAWNYTCRNIYIYSCTPKSRKRKKDSGCLLTGRPVVCVRNSLLV